MQNLKFVALPVPGLIGGTLKLRAAPGYAHALFSAHFNGLLFAWTLGMYRPNLKSVALPVPEIIARKLCAVPGYAVQGYSRSLILVPIESAYKTSY